MKIQTFNNMRGLIHGSDPKRIGCDKAGVLKIGNTEISISPGTDSIMPQLFNGSTGECRASFTDAEGLVYELEKVAVRGGWITPPPPATVELMELRCRLDAAEKKNEDICEEIRELRNIFDTNSLNFLIN